MIPEFINRVMTKVFGASWQTGFWGTLSFFSGTAELWQEYLKDCGIKPSVSRFMTLLFGLFAFLAAKDKNVTGGTVQNVKPAGKP